MSDELFNDLKDKVEKCFEERIKETFEKTKKIYKIINIVKIKRPCY
jgi:hypothetical protein